MTVTFLLDPFRCPTCQIAQSSHANVALVLDVVDFLDSIGAEETEGRASSLMAMSTVVAAARAAGLQA